MKAVNLKSRITVVKENRTFIGTVKRIFSGYLVVTDRNGKDNLVYEGEY